MILIPCLVALALAALLCGVLATTAVNEYRAARLAWPARERLAYIVYGVEHDRQAPWVVQAIIRDLADHIFDKRFLRQLRQLNPPGPDTDLRVGALQAAVNVKYGAHYANRVLQAMEAALTVARYGERGFVWRLWEGLARGCRG